MKLITSIVSATIGLLLVIGSNPTMAQQWAGSSTTTGNINRTGDVSIGTSATGAKLRIDAPTDAGILLERNNNIFVDTQARLGISSNGGIPGMRIRISSNNGTSFSDAIFVRENANVGIRGTLPSFPLDVNGSVRATSFITSSDERLKTNIQSVGNSLSKISELRGVRYEFNQTYARRGGTETGSKIGFVAQEVQKVFPELVHQDDDGYFAVDYVSMIPILVEAIKQQNSELEELRTKLQAMEEGTLQSTNLDQGTTKAVLFQNTPNPFNQVSQINYFLPEDSNEASIFIYNLNGKQVRKYDLRTKGHGSVDVGGFEAGMYIYTMVVDGQELGSKRMILTE